jgi:hypothetical protein
MKECRDSMKRSLISYLSKKRIKIISNDDWWRLLYKYNPIKKIEKEQCMKDSDELNKIILSADSGFNFLGLGSVSEDQMQDKNIKNDINDMNCKKVDKKSSDFLPPLKFLNLRTEDYRMWDDKGLIELSNENLLFGKMRENVIDNLNKVKKLIYLDKTEIVCGLCNSYICAAKNAENSNDVLFKMSGYLSAFINIEKFGDIECSKSPFAKELFNQVNFNSLNCEWLTCKVNKHVLGIKIEHDFFVTSFSQLRLHFPDDVYKKWDSKYWKDNFKCLKEEEKESLVKRKEKLEKDMKCELCRDKKFNTNDDFLFHIDKDMEHKKMIGSLLEEIFE